MWDGAKGYRQGDRQMKLIACCCSCWNLWVFGVYLLAYLTIVAVAEWWW